MAAYWPPQINRRVKMKPAAAPAGQFVINFDKKRINTT
jgi:hypothetical protein